MQAPSDGRGPLTRPDGFSSYSCRRFLSVDRTAGRGRQSRAMWNRAPDTCLVILAAAARRLFFVFQQGFETRKRLVSGSRLLRAARRWFLIPFGDRIARVLVVVAV